jgi:hypothetical protein
MAAVVQVVLLAGTPEAMATKAPHLATCMVKAAAWLGMLGFLVSLAVVVGLTPTMVFDMPLPMAS